MALQNIPDRERVEAQNNNILLNVVKGGIGTVVDSLKAVGDNIKNVGSSIGETIREDYKISKSGTMGVALAQAINPIVGDLARNVLSKLDFSGLSRITSGFGNRFSMYGGDDTYGADIGGDDQTFSQASPSTLSPSNQNIKNGKKPKLSGIKSGSIKARGTLSGVNQMLGNPRSPLVQAAQAQTQILSQIGEAVNGIYEISKPKKDEKPGGLQTKYAEILSNTFGPAIGMIINHYTNKKIFGEYIDKLFGAQEYNTSGVRRWRDNESIRNQRHYGMPENSLGQSDVSMIQTGKDAGKFIINSSKNSLAGFYGKDVLIKTGNYQEKMLEITSLIYGHMRDNLEDLVIGVDSIAAQVDPNYIAKEFRTKSVDLSDNIRKNGMEGMLESVYNAIKSDESILDAVKKSSAYIQMPKGLNWLQGQAAQMGLIGGQFSDGMVGDIRNISPDEISGIMANGSREYAQSFDVKPKANILNVQKRYLQSIDMYTFKIYHLLSQVFRSRADLSLIDSLGEKHAKNLQTKFDNTSSNKIKSRADAKAEANAKAEELKAQRMQDQGNRSFMSRVGAWFTGPKSIINNGAFRGLLFGGAVGALINTAVMRTAVGAGMMARGALNMIAKVPGVVPITVAQAVIGGIGALFNKYGGIKGLMGAGSFGEILKEFVSGSITSVKNTFVFIINKAIEGINWVASTIFGKEELIKWRATKTQIDEVRETINNIIIKAREWWDSTWPVVKFFVGGIINGLNTIRRGISGIFGIGEDGKNSIFTNIWTVITGVFEAAWKLALPIFLAKQLLPMVFGAVGSGLGLIFPKLFGGQKAATRENTNALDRTTAALDRVVEALDNQNSDGGASDIVGTTGSSSLKGKAKRLTMTRAERINRYNELNRIRAARSGNRLSRARLAPERLRRMRQMRWTNRINAVRSGARSVGGKAMGVVGGVGGKVAGVVRGVGGKAAGVVRGAGGIAAGVVRGAGGIAKQAFGKTIGGLSIAQTAITSGAGKIATATLGKTAAGMAGKIASKAIPGVGLAMAGYDLYRMFDEEKTLTQKLGIGIQALGGIASTIPAVGTVVSLGLTAVGGAMEMFGGESEQAHKDAMRIEAAVKDAPHKAAAEMAAISEKEKRLAEMKEAYESQKNFIDIMRANAIKGAQANDINSLIKSHGQNNMTLAEIRQQVINQTNVTSQPQSNRPAYIYDCSMAL